MRELKITQDQYNELCCNGKLASAHYMVYSIHWLSYFDMLAVRVDDANEKEFIRLVVE